MLTSLYMLSLTVLLTFLVIYAADKLVNRLRKVKSSDAPMDPVPSEVEFSNHTFK